VLHSFQ